MSKKRRRFTAADKQRVALAAIKGEQTISEIAGKFQVHPTQVNKWKKELLSYISGAFTRRTDSLKEDHAQKLGELYQQIGKLKVENDFLKKKSGELDE